MSKKTFIAAIIITAFLISLVAGMQAVKVAKANPIPWCFNPQMTVTIQSPVSGANCALPLLVSFTAQGDFQFSVSDNVTQDYLRSFFYVLDGQDMSTSGLRFAGTKTTEIYGDPVYKYNFSGQANLTDITDGLHNITVYYGAVNSVGLIGSPSEWIVYNPSWQATSQFYVDSTLTPSPTLTLTPSPSSSPSPTPSPSPSSTQQPALIVLVDSPQNKTYTTNYVPVFISASDPTKNIGPESIAYSLDGGDKQTIASVHVGAHSLNGSTGIFVPDGSHSLVAIATTWFNGGVYRSAPIYFTINTSPPTPTASVPVFPSWIILPLLITVVIGVGLLVYFKKRKH